LYAENKQEEGIPELTVGVVALITYMALEQCLAVADGVPEVQLWLEVLERQQDSVGRP